MDTPAPLSPMNLSTLGKLTDAEARAVLERIQWPNGPVCPHCGTIGEAARMKSGDEAKHKIREGVWNCRACDQPFSVTVGTIMESSHIPLGKWLLAFFIFASAKKSVSALQLQRQLGLGSYRSAWHMAHRIRHAMQNDPKPPKLSGHVEADEGYIGGRPRHHKPHKGKPRTSGGVKIPVAVLVERDGGARARAMTRITAKGVRRFIAANVDRKSSTLYTDESKLYGTVGRTFAGGHHTTRHEVKEYARPGGIHSNTAENFIGLFKRAVNGSWHHISEQHVQAYLDEATFRWGAREMTDTERTELALQQAPGVRLYYRKPRRPPATGEGESLVAGS